MFGRHPKNDAQMRLAAEAAEQRRTKLLAQRKSFVAETVFSHDSKVQLMRDAIAQGYFVRLTFICVEGASLCALRVHGRAVDGGHDVPLDRLAARFARRLMHAEQGVLIAHSATVIDNTSAQEPPMRNQGSCCLCAIVLAIGCARSMGARRARCVSQRMPERAMRRQIKQLPVTPVLRAARGARSHRC